MYIPSPSIQPIAVDGYNPSGIWGRNTMSFYYNSHTTSSNIAFVDGHAVMRPFEELEARYRAIWW
jgi:prepilin-type processing-associated H-X9-DG protein